MSILAFYLKDWFIVISMSILLIDIILVLAFINGKLKCLMNYLLGINLILGLYMIIVMISIVYNNLL